MASRTATVSTTIHDVKQIFQGFDENDSFQTVLDNEDFFTRICDAVLRPIYRCATQSKNPRHNKKPPRTRIIQEIAVQEGISHELPSTLEHTATSENPPQRVTQESTKTPEHNHTLETSPSPERSAIQEPPSAPEYLSTSDISLSLERSATQALRLTPGYTTPGCTATSEHNQTPETSPTSQQSATQEPPLSPEHSSVPDISLSSGRSATQERIETPDSTSVTDSNSNSDDALCAEHFSLSGDASTPTASIPNSKRRLDIDSAPDSAVELSDTFQPPSSPRAESPITVEEPDSGIELSNCTADEDLAPLSSPRAESSVTVDEPDSGIELSNSTADKDLTPFSSPRAEGSVTVEEPDSGIELSNSTADEDLAPLSSPRAESSVTVDEPDSGIELSNSTTDEDLTLLSSPRAESSVTVEELDSGIELSNSTADEDLTPFSSAQVEQDQIIPGDQATSEDQTESLYANRPSTNKISPKFNSWIQNPKEEFWKHAENTIGLKDEGDASTRLKVFVRDALTKKADAELHKLRYRFTSILVYQSFQQTMGTDIISPRLTQHFLERMDIPLESEQDCLLLLHGGRNRIDFDQQISPDRDEIDHGPQCLPDINDNIWDYTKSSHFRAKAKTTAAKLRLQDITSWSETSGAQSAAKEILLYGQKLLDLVDWQTKGNRTKKGELEIIDQTSSSDAYSIVYSITKRKRELEIVDETSSSDVNSFHKRIRTNATTSPPNLQSSQPNIHQSTTTLQPNFQNSSPTISPPAVNNSSPYTHTNPVVFQPNRPTSAPTENPFNLSMRTKIFARTQSSPSWNSSLPPEPSRGIEDSIQRDEDAARNTNGYSDEHLANWEIPAVDALSSATAYEFNALLCDPEWYSRDLDLGSPEDSFDPQAFFSAMM